MTTSDRAREVAETDADALGYWCQQCRKAGMIHCSEVEHCGCMELLPYSERAKRHAAILQEQG